MLLLRFRNMQTSPTNLSQLRPFWASDCKDSAFGSHLSDRSSIVFNEVHRKFQVKILWSTDSAKDAACTPTCAAVVSAAPKSHDATRWLLLLQTHMHKFAPNHT